MKYLLDSVIVIDHFNGVAKATRYLAENAKHCALSVITRAEVLAGFDAKEAELARKFLDTFQTLPVTIEVADIAAQLRRSARLKLPDALQAAIATHHRLSLVTRYTRGFSNTVKFGVLVPYRL